MADQPTLTAGTIVDLGVAAQIMRTDVKTVGSWRVYKALANGEPHWLREYFPTPFVQRHGADGMVPAVDSAESHQAWEEARTDFERLAATLTGRMLPGTLTVEGQPLDHPYLRRSTHWTVTPGGAMLLAGPDNAARSVADHLADGDRFCPAGAMRLAAHLADALAASHDRELLHLNVHPETILLDGNRVALEGFSLDERAYMNVVGSKDAFVRPPYSSIELYDNRRGASLTPATDVYAASALLYRVVMGVDAPSWQARMNDATISARPQSPGYPAEFLDAIERGLSLKPGDAFASALDWRDAMSLGDAGDYQGGWFESEDGGRKKWPFHLILLCALVVVGASALIVWMNMGIPAACPGNTIRSGTACIAPPPQPCPTGKIRQGPSCIAPQPLSCPDGKVRSGKECIDPKPAPCPEGSIREGELCVTPTPTPTLLCPNDQVRSGWKCVEPPPKPCPDGMIAEGKRCVEPPCPEGSVRKGTKCVERPLPGCPSGTVRKGKSCVALPPLPCRLGMVRQGGKCITPPPPQCPAGTIRRGLRCVPPSVPSPPSPLCPVGMIRSGQRCVPTNF